MMGFFSRTTLVLFLGMFRLFIQKFNTAMAFSIMIIFDNSIGVSMFWSSFKGTPRSKARTSQFGITTEVFL
jgi:hypothetical protein